MALSFPWGSIPPIEGCSELTSSGDCTDQISTSVCADLKEAPMFAEEPDPGRKNHHPAWADVCRRRPWRDLNALLWSYTSFLLPASINPTEHNTTLCLDMGTLEKWLFTIISPRLTRKQEHRMVFKCTLWLKARKQLASGQAMRMNNNILGQRRRWAQLFPAIIWLLKMYLNGKVVN